MNKQTALSAFEQVALQSKVEALQARLAMQDEVLREVAMLRNLSSYFARFHCSDDACMCHNCNLHRALADIQAASEAYEQRIRTEAKIETLEDIKQVCAISYTAGIVWVRAYEMAEALRNQQGETK